MTLMVEAGFTSTFVGIETPEEKSLQDCNKKQNGNRDLLHSVIKMQNAGLQVSGGFIVGFDSDTPAVFERQIDFIQKSGIVAAMVGLLNAPKNTKLYKRLEAENRITIEATGNNCDSSINYKRAQGKQMKIEFFHVGAFIKSMVIIGMLNKGRREYWKLMIWTILRRPSLLVDAITFAVYGYHFRIIYGLTSSR